MDQTGAPQTSILLADDSKTFLMYAGLLIKRLGYHAFLAHDGVEAIKVAKERRPSLIVLDYVMPKLNGSSCLTVIRNDADIKDIPVLIVTSLGDLATRKELEMRGCNGFLTKPLNVGDFYRSINDCLRFGNKRKNIRAALRLKVYVECGDERRELYASTISAEGMFLRTVAPFGKGTAMTVVFSVDDDDPVQLESKVIYSTPLVTDLQAEPGMGIRFHDVPEDVRCRIEHFTMAELVRDLTVEGAEIGAEGLPPFGDSG